MQLIKNNPYRIGGLLVGATARVKDRQIKRLKQIIDAEQEPEDDFSFSILGKINRTIDVVNDAASKLNLDNDKMNAALFWFYNGNEITDELAFDLLKDGKIKETAAIWTKLVKDKPVESKNASAFQNLSTLLLNHAIKDDIIKENLFEDGIWLKLKFLESDFAKDLKALATDETYRTTKKELQLLFLNQLQSEIERHGGINSDRFINILKKQEFSAKEDFFKGFVLKPLDEIEKQINEARNIRKTNNFNIIAAGKTLYKITFENIALLKSILGASHIKFSSISDRVSNEILQCGIEYFNKNKDSEIDVENATMDLFRLARALSIGNITMQRCRENTKNVQDWLDDPTRKIREELEFIYTRQKILQEQKSYEVGCKTLDEYFTLCEPKLLKIRDTVGITHDFYFKCRSDTIQIALNKLITLINDVVKSKPNENLDFGFPMSKKINGVYSLVVVYPAHEAFLKKNILESYKFMVRIKKMEMEITLVTRVTENLKILQNLSREYINPIMYKLKDTQDELKDIKKWKFLRGGEDRENQITQKEIDINSLIKELKEFDI